MKHYLSRWALPIACYNVAFNLLLFVLNPAWGSMVLAWAWLIAGFTLVIRRRRRSLQTKPDAAVIAALEHQLEIAGHEKTCIRCNPSRRLPERFSRGGYVRKPDRKMRLSRETAPARGGDLSVIYADECFLSEEGICVRLDDIHEAARIGAGHSWTCPLHD